MSRLSKITRWVQVFAGSRILKEKILGLVRESANLIGPQPELVEAMTLSSTREISRGGNILREMGTVVVPSSIDRELLSKTSDIFLSFAGELDTNSSPRSEGYRLAHESEPYPSLVAGDRPAVVLRTGVDHGMVDIFNADRLPGVPGKQLREAIESSGVIRILETGVGDELTFSNFNVYVNRSVTRTRGFHVDSWGQSQYKLFLYLTDVRSLEDGPYTYIPYSHVDRDLELGNRLFNLVLRQAPTDVSLYGPLKPVPLVSEAGSVIISNQSGAHRGYPQADGHCRVLAVMNFRTKGVT